MSVQRVYRPALRPGTTMTELDREDFHYLKHVLRLKVGDTVILFDGVGNEYEAVIDDFGASRVRLEIREERPVDDPAPPVILAQALPKEGKMDFIVQKATELGVRTIIPFTSSRTIPRLTGEKAAARVKRWRKIAAEASKQCGNAIVPEVSEIRTFEAMIDEGARASLPLFFWEEEHHRGIRDIFSTPFRPDLSEISIVVGPEGGFSRDEATAARNRGFMTAHLGRRILRVETAALVILSIIQYEIGSIGTSPERNDVQ
ncbi:MAG: 16S rRNA (uracil(1498)-N(3))-methyltransferase [Syntrophales bacterium]|nr:16S rRNA (uracil(1498)-N(3))-methyltransferase [Syntrophales bacterium]MCK9527298.1 16S rRNA (uracil(1498)-N(3))-methyltransferase [Syntrophales bacterium]MDX9921232.1 16S rRNA (uracil(1498)-N(3))-methyltransferase [Syntrophales bacterium]